MWVVQIWLISVSNITFYYSFELYCLWTLSTHIISDNIAWPQTRCVARISPREEGGGVPYFLLNRNKQWRFKLLLFILHICYLKGIEGRWRRFVPSPVYTLAPGRPNTKSLEEGHCIWCHLCQITWAAKTNPAHCTGTTFILLISSYSSWIITNYIRW